MNETSNSAFMSIFPDVTYGSLSRNELLPALRNAFPVLLMRSGLF
nr:MAG TPA_asm: hypothetical protein [Caudoviricetes sp.]